MASSEPPVSLLESSTAEQTPPPLRILCFGDSLTCGLSLNVHGFQEDPYSRRLEERLRAAFPDRRITIATDGLPGDMVTIPSFVDRLENAYRRCSEGFDWTIILAGTNDLPCMTIPMIQAGLTSVWQFAQDHGARVLAMTVPELTHRYHHLDEKRNELNQWIMSQRMDGFYPFDLHAVIPYHSLSPAEQQKYWSDSVHLSAAGYSWMGDHIADVLIDLIKNDV